MLRVACRRDHCGNDESDRLAAAFGPRLPCRRGAEEASLNLSSKKIDGDRIYRIAAPVALVPALADRAAARLKQHAPRDDWSGVAGQGDARRSRSRACAVSMSGNFEPDGTRCSGGQRPLTFPAICCFAFWLIGFRPIS